MALTATVQDMRRDRTNGEMLDERPALLSILRSLQLPSTDTLIVPTLYNLVTPSSAITPHPSLTKQNPLKERNIQKAHSPPQPS